MSDLNVSSLTFDPLCFDSTLNAHSSVTDTDCNIDNVMTCDCRYFDSDALNQHIENTNYNLSLYHFNARSLKGVLHLLPQINMFCALSQNNQHRLEKYHMHLIVNCSRNSKMALKF